MDKGLFSRIDQAQLRTLCLVVLTVLAVVTALKLGQALIAPILAGLVLGLVLGPVLRRFDAAGAPPFIGAACSLLLALLIIAAGGLFAAPMVAAILDVLPQISDRLERWVEHMTYSLRGLEELERDIREGSDGAMDEAIPSVADALWLAPGALAQALIAICTLFFFVLTRQKLYGVLSDGTRTRMLRADCAVSHYFLTISIINLGLGCVVTGAMMVIGMANPILWGAAAAVLNFMLYLGPAILVVSLLVAGVMQFSGVMVLVPAVSYMLINICEAQFVTPSLVGQRLALNPLAVFLSIVFGIWLWGPIGGILALPVLVWVWVASGYSDFEIPQENAAPGDADHPSIVR